MLHVELLLEDGAAKSERRKQDLVPNEIYRLLLESHLIFFILMRSAWVVSRHAVE